LSSWPPPTPAPEDSRFNWSTQPLPATTLFISLLALAVLLQALQSLSRFVNNVSVGTFAAECRAKVTARIHSQVLRLSFACASGSKAGDLTNDASQGPEAIRIQIEQSGWGKAGLASP
jgi:subfamily B ATP-binding cassette protein MsbA